MVDNLINNISKESIQDFFRTNISSYRLDEETLDYILPEKGYENFVELTKLGEVDYANTDELLVFSCKYVGELSDRSSKKKQFDIAKKVLKEDFKDGAIFVFYDELGKFRFSLIRKNYGEKDKKYSNWKRYTYFVDPKKTNRTFIQRIEACNFSSLDEILEAFSVEPLNKEFYNKIVRSFYSLVGGEIGTGRNTEMLEPNLSLPGNEKDRTIVRQFGIRLVGRIIFCWFLKHKSSVSGVSLIPDDWLSSITVEDNYYHSMVEQLFFEILNKEFQYRSKLLPKGHEAIPFLNGGLFESQTGIYQDYYVSSKTNYALKISDNWFKELFEILEQFNFTIDENSITDAEVSIDPEMLGRIFENLLAEIDPNLTTSEITSVRNATGSFYTPREVVDYMVEEALVKYLHNQTQICQRSLHMLFGDQEEILYSENDKDKLLDAFDRVKILDPAAGSGAFPMGALHKIVSALQKLDPGAEKWKTKQLDKITNAALKAEMKTILDRANAEYSRKLGVLQHCIYGADIQPIAAEISRLRGFLSLIVDEEIDDNKPNRGILALPNLEFKFVTANTLVELDNTGKIETTKVSDLLPQLQKIRSDYLQAHGDEKDKLQDNFEKIQKEIFTDQLDYDPNMQSRPMQLAAWNPFKNEKVNWFDSEWMFGIKQFDIVIGNPPYGGIKISDELQASLGLGSKDPYGAFIAKFLSTYQHITPHLKDGGFLAYIVSDTFMSITTHKELRDFILNNKIHSMIRVHQDTFKATVNTAVIICERLEEKKGCKQPVLMADFTNTSINEQHDRFIQLMDKVTEYNQPIYEGESFEQEGVLYMKGDDWTSESSQEYAVYTYSQKLIENNTNHPFFVASTKLFGLTNDTTAPQKQTKIEGRKVQTRIISINDHEVEVVKLGEVAIIKQGLATGDNNTYLFQNPEVRGNYKNIHDFKEYLLNEKDLDKIRSNNELRQAIIDRGISKDNPETKRYFGGRYIVPYDKGGESDADEGWLPNYHVPSNYYIDWSEWAIERMKTLTIGKRDNTDNTRICSRFQSVEYSFLEFLTYSRTGIYAPTFRLGSGACFDSKSNSVVFVNPHFGQVITSSKTFKTIYKNFHCHTVQAEANIMLEFPFLTYLDNLESAILLVKKIYEQQRLDSKYDYSSNEQLEIDYLIYQAYGLNWSDVREAENWYARRYPKLVNAQKRNLADLGKPTDYIEIYKGFVEKHGDLN